MLLAESIAIAVPCELNRLFFLTTKTYVVVRSTKVTIRDNEPRALPVVQKGRIMMVLFILTNKGILVQNS